MSFVLATLAASLMGGCSAIPESIPQKPGVFGGEGDLRRAWLTVNPDSAVGPFLLANALSTMGDGTCPARQDTEDGWEYEGLGCTDTYGITWHGQLEFVEEDSGTVADWRDFGPESGGDHWTLRGRTQWTYLDSSSDLSLRHVVAVDYQGADDVYEAWQDLNFVFRWNDGDYMLEDYDGEIGIEDWGLADVASTGNIYLGAALSCEHPSGSGLSIYGENGVSVDFGEHTPGECSACPTWSLAGEPQAEPYCGPSPTLSLSLESG
jgi:hypothetical protein